MTAPLGGGEREPRHQHKQKRSQTYKYIRREQVSEKLLTNSTKEKIV